MYLKLIFESLRFAISALINNRLRTILSLVGVTIGVFTIIAILTSVDALKRNIKSNIDKLGSNTITIQRWPISFEDDYPWWKFVKRKPVTEKQFDDLVKKAVLVDNSAFYIQADAGVVSYKNNSVSSGVFLIGMTENMNKVYDISIKQGRYFSKLEFRDRSKSVIIGYNIAEGLFPNENPLGKSIKIKGHKATVIGVLQKDGASVLKFSNNDDCIFLTSGSIKSMINTNNRFIESAIMLRGKEGVSADELEAEIDVILRSIRKIKPNQESDFAINKMSTISKQFDKLFDVLNLAGWVIGAFSILVGGFGIANIMFVSVKERTGIIGIQKSLGAKNYFILLQFLIESTTLCLIGGIIGIIFVSGLSVFATHNFGIDFHIRFSNIITGIGLSVIIGIISGFIPAYQASKLNPVDAIRQN